MKHKIKKQSYGFTLLETLIYLGLFSILIGTGYVTAMNLVQSNEHIEALLAREEEKLFLEKKIEWALSGVKMVHSPVENATSSLLSIDTVSEGSPLTFDLADGCLRFSQSGYVPVCLTTDRVHIDHLEFTHHAKTSTTSESISAMITINGEKSETMVQIHK